MHDDSLSAPVSRRRVIVTLDGPAGSGKSTTARRLAEALGYLYVDSGALYRALALAVLRASCDPADNAHVIAVAQRAEVSLAPRDTATAARSLAEPHVYLDGEDVTDLLRTADVDRVASTIAQLHDVRERLLALQREAGVHGGVVMEGRDIGTVVFPHAEVKIYLTADLAVRSARRLHQREDAGMPQPGTLDDTMHELAARDERDFTRAESPLKVPDGALTVDTTHITFDQQVGRILDAVRSAEMTAGGAGAAC